MDPACSPLSTEIIAICSLLGSWLGVKGAKYSSSLTNQLIKHDLATFMITKSCETFKYRRQKQINYCMTRKHFLQLNLIPS
jgi:hypothetical protein